MLRKLTLFCKLLHVRRTAAAAFCDCMSDYSPQAEVCPECGSIGRCGRHGSYKRVLIDFDGRKTIYPTVTVTQVICHQCRHTHAVLPDVIVPYGQYSLLFLMRVLSEYFYHIRTVAAICERFDITITMLYRWRDLFLRHAGQWLQTLDGLCIPEAFLTYLLEKDSFSLFFSEFHLQFQISFLQQHKGRSFLT